MTETDKIVNALTDVLESSVNDFIKAVPGIEDKIFAEVVGLIKDLEVSNGRIKNNIANIRTIGKIKTQLRKIILSKEYLKNVSKYIKQFDNVSALQNKYFNSLQAEFSAGKVYEEIKLQSIDSALESLTESGITENVIKPIQDILRQNITGGGTITKFVGQMREFITNTDAGDGKLLKYSKQIVTDSINQYNRQYGQIVSDDLGWNWFEYSGSLIKTSREFCVHMVKKRYIHRSEFTTVLKGDIDGKEIAVYDKTGLPYGLIAGTDQYNFPVYAGGYQCGHLVRPVPDVVVPIGLRTAL